MRGWHHEQVPARVRVILALVVMASVTVMALPSTKLAPLGVANPAPTLVAAGVAAVALLLLGVVLSAPAGPRGAATLGLLVAAALVSGSAVGATPVPALASSLAWLLSVMLVPATVQLSLAWPQGLPEARSERLLVAATWALLGLAGLARLAVWDPFADATCVLRCGDNPLAIFPDPQLARTLLDAVWLGTAVACALTAARVLRPGRFWVGGVACVVLATDALLRLTVGGPLPHGMAIVLLLARCVALAMVGGALVMAGGIRLRRHLRLVRLAADLDASPAPGTYEASLRDALGDPTLRIAYPVDGHPVVEASSGVRPPLGGRGQASTVLVRSGAPVAVITHEARHTEALAAALGPAARMAIDNERLQDHLRSRLDELRASRERIVERSDSERLRLERDLHDGAQQRLLMIGYELHRAAQADGSLGAALEGPNSDVASALHELRDIAHGIYPGILESLGLPAALDALADGPTPFTLDECPAQRLAPQVERAVYHVVSTALDHQRRTEEGRASPVTAAVAVSGSYLQLRLTGLGPLPPALAQRWEDRVGALGGVVRLSSSALECVLPCE